MAIQILHGCFNCMLKWLKITTAIHSLALEVQDSKIQKALVRKDVLIATQGGYLRNCFPLTNQRFFRRLSFAMLACWHPGAVTTLFIQYQKSIRPINLLTRTVLELPVFFRQLPVFFRQGITNKLLDKFGVVAKVILCTCRACLRKK